MRQSSKIKSQILNSSTFSQINKRTTILVLILSFLLGPKVPVSAQSHSKEVQNLPYQSYLPIALRTGGAYYVSPIGDDINPGTILRPWRTISKAATMVKPGDTVYIRDGTYYEKEPVFFETSGTTSSPISILAYPGENPIMDGVNTNQVPGSALLWIVGNYINASGIEVRNSASMGILVLGNYDVVNNMYVHHNKSTGILIYKGHYSIVENSRIWRNSLANEFGQEVGWSEGLGAARGGVSNATIRNNIVWENWGEGLSTFEADHTVIEDNIVHDNFSTNIYISDATNILCQRNFVYTDPTSYVFPYGENGGIMMGDETNNPPSANITVINNISFGNHGNFWWWQGAQGGGMNNVLIANNTFVNGIGDRNHGEGGVIISLGQHQNVRFEDNIVQQDGNLPVIATHDQPGVTYSHNLWSKTPYPAASGPGDIIGDPLLANSGDPYLPNWFRLTDFSPAIDAAIPLPEVTVDFFGTSRGDLPDLGAIEFIRTLKKGLYIPR
jgi:hypothetical protein